MVAELTADLESGSAAGTAQERLLVEFELDQERYGVDIADIREIIRYQAITVIPGTPEVVEGIINLRGRVTPIVDLRKRIGLHATEVNDATRIIVIEVDDALVGVHVDAVTGVVGLTNDQLQPMTDQVTTDRSEYLEGVADIDGRLIVLINLQRALQGGAQTMAPARERDRPADIAAGGIAEPAELTAEPEGIEAIAIPEASDDTPTDSATTEPVSAETVEPSTEEPETDSGRELPLQIELLEQSFEAVKPRGEELVALFYDKLFEQHPAVQPLFAELDMTKQQGKLLSSLALVVASLRQPDTLVPHLQELGRRHVDYGTEPVHYEAVGGVLLESLGDIAGELWTDELRDAWTDAITLVASVMIDAASEVSMAPTTPPVEVAEPEVKPKTEAKVETPKRTRKPAAEQATSARSPRKLAATKATSAKARAKKASAKPRARKKAASAD